MKSMFRTFHFVTPSKTVCGNCSRRRKEAESSSASSARIHLLTSAAAANRDFRTRSKRELALERAIRLPSLLNGERD